MTQRIDSLPLDAIVEGPNYRNHYPDLTRLEASIRAQGILQPLIARPLRPDGGYQLVIGFCRLRAARKAGLTHVPVIVREIRDDEILELQLAENHDRTDTHPLDDAAAFGELRRRGLSVDEIAARVRRSSGYVYGRLRLLELSPKVLDALETRELPLLHAIEIGRLEDHASQDEVLAKAWTWNHVWTTMRELRRIVAQSQHALTQAPWDVDDAQLVADAGACSACPYRTHAQPELWPDEHAGPDLCLRASCWSGKAAAHRARQVAALSEKHGVELAEVGVAPPWLDYHGSRTYGQSKGLVVLQDDVVNQGTRTTWAKAVKAAKRPKPAGVVFAAAGEAVVVYREKDLAEAAGIEILKPASSTRSHRDDEAARRRRTEAARREWDAVLDACLPKLRDSASADEAAELWRLVLRLAARSIRYDAAALVTKRRGWDKRQVGEHQAYFAGLSQRLSPAECRALVIELLAAEDYPGTYGPAGMGTAAPAIAAAVGVDVAAIRRATRAAARKAEKAKAAKKATRKPAAKARAKGAKAKASKKPARKNPWKSMTPEQRLERVNRIRKGRGIAPVDQLAGAAAGGAA